MKYILPFFLLAALLVGSCRKAEHEYSQIDTFNDTVLLTITADSNLNQACFYPHKWVKVQMDIPGFKYWGENPSDTIREKVFEEENYTGEKFTETVIDSLGNVNTAVNYLEIEKCTPTVYIPNAFVPTYDLSNGNWAPITNNITEIYFSVMDEYNTVIFESKSTDNKWNGNYRNGTQAPQGVYYYYVRYSTLTETNVIRTGRLYMTR